MKTKLLLLTGIIVIMHFSLHAQVKIGNNPTTINSASLLELESNNQGLVLPRVALTDVNSSAPLAAGLLKATVVYDTSASTIGGSGIGIYYWDGSKWNFIANTSLTGSSFWSLTGNAGTNASTNFIGTTDAVDFVAKTNNTERMRILGSASGSSQAGWIGMGISLPRSSLDVAGNFANKNVITIQNTSSTGFTSIDMLDNTGSLKGTFGYANTGTGGNFAGRTYFNSYGNDMLFTANSGTYHLFLKGGTGYIGINTNSPSERLHVVGNFYLAGAFMPGGSAGTSGYILTSAGTNTAPTWTNPNSLAWGLTGNSGLNASTNFIGTTDAVDLIAKTNNVERIRVTSSGNVGIGISNPSYALSVLSTSNPLYLSGVQATGAFTTDSLLTIYNGVVKKAPYSALTGATTHTLNLSGNTLTSIVNGISATASTVGSVSNTSNANTIKTTVNGVAGSTVNIINSNANALTQAGGLVNTVNGVAATTSIPSGTVSNVLGYNSTGVPVYQSASNVLSGSTTNTNALTQAGGLVNTVNGVVATTSIPSGTVNNILGYSSSGTPVYQSASNVLGASTTNTLTLNTNTLTSTVNGIAATSNAVSGVDNTSSANTLSTTVNGVTGSNVNIINSNTKTWTQAGGITTSVNGIASNVTPASGTINNVLGYNTTGDPVYQSASSILSGTTTNILSLSGNTLSSSVNGVSDTANTVSSVSNTSNANTIKTTVNGVVGATVNIINSNSNALTQAGGLVNTVNGISATTSIPGGTVNNVLGYNSTGSPVYQSASTILSGATTNSLNLTGNTLTSTVNGISDTSKAVSGVSNTSNVNTLSTTVNGITGSSVNIVNSNANSLSQTGGLVNTVNGVAATTSIPSGAVSNVLGYSSSGSPVYQSASTILSGATTNSLNLTGNTLTSTVDGVSDTSKAVSGVSNASNVNTLTTTVNGITGSSVNIVNSNANSLSQTGGLVNTVNGVTATTSIPSGAVSNVLGYSSSGSPVYQSASTILSGATTNSLNLTGNTLTSTVNGVASSSNSVGGVSNTTNANTLSTTVNGVTGSTVNIINSNIKTWTQAAGLTTTVNGISSNITPASGTISNVLGYNSAGTPVYQSISGLGSIAWYLAGNSGTTAGTNFIGTTDNVDFVTKTNNVERLRVTSGGNVGIGLSNPSYALSVLSASNPLYLSGVQTTTTFSLDSILTINNGIVKKAPYAYLPTGGSSSGWSLTGNSGTNSSTNFLGTTDLNALVFKVNNTQAGYLGTTSNYATALGLNASATGNQSTAIGAKAQATASNASLAVGYNATANAQDAIAIGDAAQAISNNEAIAIGHNSTSSAYQGIAIGVSSTASSNNQTIAIGTNSTASAYQSVAIGYGSSATTNNSSLAVGVSASASGYQSTAIGSGATASAQNSTAIGNGAFANNSNTLILGNGANVGIGLSNPSNKLSVLASSDPLYLSGVQATSSFTTDSILTINAGVVKKTPNSSLTGNFWSLNGNPASSGNFLGTTNTTPLVFKFNSLSAGYLDATSTSLGTGSSATAASSNTAIGYSAIANSSDHETSIGANASATAQYNTALGYNAQAVNNSQATAIGSTSQANAYQSTALGYNAQATTNSQTTALGNNSLANGTYSTAVGYYAQAVTNSQTTAVGGLSTSNGYQSAAFGYNAQAITSSQTTAIGVGALANSTASTALGYNALAKTSSNGTALGSNTLTTGQYATAIGSFASASAQNATAIGYNTTASNANTLILGNAANVGIGLINPANKLSVLAASDPLYLSGVQATSTFNTDSVLTINAGVVKKAPYSSLTGNFWSLSGNTGTNPGLNYLGTTDNVGLHFRTNNIERMVIDSVGSVAIGSTNFDPNLREKLLVDYGNTSSNNVANFTGSINDYMQIQVQNKSNGTGASSDIVATADDGTDSTNYVDFGINGSRYAPGTENWGGAHDAYLYSYSHNLLIGTGKSNSDIIFMSGGGVAKTNMVLRVDGPTGNIIIGKGENSNIATGNTLRAPNAGSNNIGGGILTLQGGSATGSGAGGNVVLNGGTSPSGIAGNIVFNTASSERVRVDQNGNVGIGNASPSNKLSVIASSNPLYLAGVQATSTFSSDSLLTINSGIVKKTPYSSLTGNFWTINGNGGTTASTNFIGTTDANDFVTRTNNTERMRVTSAGDIVIGANDNSSSATGGIIRSSSVTGGGNKAGTDLTIQSGNGTGNGGSGDIIFQTATAGSANGSAVDIMTEKMRLTDAGNVGIGNSNPANKLSIISSSNPLYLSGVQAGAQTDSVLTISGGVVKKLSNADNFIQNQSDNQQDANFYISGPASIGAGNSVNAQLYVANSSAAGYGITGINNAALGTNYGNGLVGITSQANGVGIWGANQYTGNTVTSGTGVMGTIGLTGWYLPSGSGGAFTGTNNGIYATATHALSPGIPVTGLYTAIGNTTSVNGTICRVNYWSGTTQYKIIGSGTVSTTAKGVDDNSRVVLHASEAPEIYFEDYGEGKLINGKSHINLDPLMTKNIIVNEKHPLRVFIQLDGDCNGVYVTNKSKDGFDVVELTKGTSNVSFEWHIIGNRADEVLPNGTVSHNADVRFEAAPKDLQAEKVISKEGLSVLHTN